MSGGDESPLARWSRRKTEARTDAPETEPGDGDAAEAEDATPDVEPPPLPPIEELDADSDYTPFLAKGVPEALTRAALRKLWLSDPVFANLDGLNDYDENYNLIDKLITAADTNYKVGRGMLSEEERDEEGLPAEEDEDAVEESIADAGENAAAGVSDSGEEEVEREDGVEES